MSQILKVVETRNEVQMILYTNIRITDHDNLEVRRQKRALRKSVSRYLRSKRRCIEALIQNNFTTDDYYCTLTFSDERYPDKGRNANFKFSYFMRMLRRNGCRNLRYLKVLEFRHGAGRYHFHVVLSGDGLTGELISEIWGRTYGYARVRRLMPWKVPGLAAYLAKEAPDIVGGRAYSRSLPPSGLADPVITWETVPDEYRMVVPYGCDLIEREPRCENAYGSVETLSYLLPAGQPTKQFYKTLGLKKT